MQKIPKKVAVITGGSNGIGNAIINMLTKDDVLTFNADLAPPANDNILCHYLNTNITKANDIDKLFVEVSKHTSSPDLLVCNAGKGLLEKITEGDPEKWQQLFELNVMGQLRTIRAFAPSMIKKGKGDIVIISSVAFNQPHDSGGIYAATKSAMKMVTETLRIELPVSIRVTTITPGVVDTSFFSSMISGQQSVESIGCGALSPDDVADAVHYAINCPRHYAINDITLRPIDQKF